MMEIHSLITQQGAAAARQAAKSKHERAVIETAVSILSTEEDTAAYSHAGFAMTSLPHKSTTETVWRRAGQNTTLIIQSGVDSRGEHIGLPFGALARMILLYLQSEACKANSPEVELGANMKQWLRAMGLNVGGKTYRLVSNQAYRISTCNLAFITESRGSEVRQNATFVDRAITMLDCLDEQPSLWQDKVVLNQHFYQSLRASPVLISEGAIRAIGGRSLVLDIYIWLCYHLHDLTAEQTIPWPLLHQQFGSGFAALRQFKAHFHQSLEIARAAYPSARVEVADKGLILRPSDPPIARVA